MGGKKKYINIFGSFTEPFSYNNLVIKYGTGSLWTLVLISFCFIYHRTSWPYSLKYSKTYLFLSNTLIHYKFAVSLVECPRVLSNWDCCQIICKFWHYALINIMNMYDKQQWTKWSAIRCAHIWTSRLSNTVSKLYSSTSVTQETPNVF